MRSEMIFATIITGDYSHFGRVWVDSIRRHYPEARVVVCLADGLQNATADIFHDVEILSAADLEIPDFLQFAFQYTPFELTCALKPFVIKQLLRDKSKLIYLDADIGLYRRLDELESALSSASIVLTPHLCRPVSSRDEQRIQRAGWLNGGCVAIRHSNLADRFVSWWADRCRSECIVDSLSGRFVDQTWLSLVPSLFEDVAICRDPTLNVAYWNLCERKLARSGDQYQVQQRPLGFFHFSGFDPSLPDQLSVHLKSMAAQTTSGGLEFNHGVTHLIAEYANQLTAAKSSWSVSTACRFQCYSDGRAVDPLHREAVRLGLIDLEAGEDPFDSLTKIEERSEPLRTQLILSRKEWQVAELQSAADRQTEWIRKRLHNRWGKRILRSLRRLFSGSGDESTSQSEASAKTSNRKAA